MRIVSQSPLPNWFNFPTPLAEGLSSINSAPYY